LSPRSAAPPQAKGTEGIKVIAQNRKAHHDYHILESLEAGLVLTGTEIKSLRAGHANINDSYARPEAGELWLVGANISPYEAGSRYNHLPTRPRKILLHRRQLMNLSREIAQKGTTLVPLKIYLKHGLAKVELALARGKKAFDKRETIAQREDQRQMRRALKVTNT